MRETGSIPGRSFAYPLTRNDTGDSRALELGESGWLARTGDGAANGNAAQAVGVASAGPMDMSGASPATVDFEDVYERHFEFVWRSLRLLGVRGDALQDAVQDVFGAVARQLEHFEGRSSLRTWVFGITQNVASNQRRTRARKLDHLEPLDDGLESREPSPEAHAQGREAADLVVRFCSELDEDRRTVFVLGLLEGVPAGEIAALLGVPSGTIYSRMFTLRRALEQRLAEREVEK